MPEPNILLTLPTPVAFLLDRLNAAGYAAYAVGGCVRDALMGTVPHDWDVCTAALPQQVEAVFEAQRIIETGLKHGTVTVLVEDTPYEITTFRTESGYSDHRRPDRVEFVPRLDQDLSRRDFTINAMAYHPDEGLVDLFGGQQDLNRGLIRCVGDPDARFGEDGLRLLRALRFAARLGFAIEDETGASIHRNRELLGSISAERIFSELKGLLLGQDAGRLLLEYQDVIFTVLPELAPMAGFDPHSPHHDADVWTHTCRAVDFGPRDATLRLALLFHDCAKPQTLELDESGQGHFYGHDLAGAELAARCLNRLRCDNDTKRTVVELVRWHDTPIPLERRPLRRRVSKLGVDRVRQLIDLRRADVLAQAREGQGEKLDRLTQAQAALDALMAEESCFSLKDLAVNGRDLIAQGFPAGPGLGTVLQGLLDAVLDERVENSREALLAWARAMNQPQKGD